MTSWCWIWIYILRMISDYKNSGEMMITWILILWPVDVKLIFLEWWTDNKRIWLINIVSSWGHVTMPRVVTNWWLNEDDEMMITWLLILWPVKVGSIFWVQLLITRTVMRWWSLGYWYCDQLRLGIALHTHVLWRSSWNLISFAINIWLETTQGHYEYHIKNWKCK